MTDRVNKLIHNLKDDEAILISSKANIFYYSGFTSEDAMLYISKEKAAILTDSRYTVQAKLEAPDFDVIINKSKEFLKGVNETKIFIEEDYISAGRVKQLNETLNEKEFLFGQALISSPRQIKDMCEINRIKAAEELGDAAFDHILKFIKPGLCEREIATELEFFLKQNGASALSFDTVCASGVRSAMPHATASEKVVKKGDLLTLDFGCVLDGYCSDMTRTIIIGTPNDRQVEIYNTVLKAQTSALEIIKPGLLCADADKAARDIITSAGYGECFGHSLGHSVGIEIHEKPSLSEKSKDVLTTGNVVTVEPGIYIEDFGGVRIEDVVAITESGYINLTTANKNLILI